MSFKESLTNGFFDRGLKIYIASAVTVFIFVITITINRVEKKIEGVDSKLFTHLTNDTLHIPREQIVTKAEFTMHCNFAEENRNNIVNALEKLETLIRSRRR